MNVCEYTPERAKLLTKLNIPEYELHISTKILWFDAMASSDIGNDHPCTFAHSHSFYELIFPLSGQIHYQCGEKSIILNATTALLIPPSASHSLSAHSEDAVKISIAFSFGDNMQQLCDVTKIPITDSILDNANYILKHIENNNFLQPAILGGRIIEILSDCFESIGLSLPETETKMTDSRVLVAKEFADNNVNRNITCEDVAKECCLSSKQLSRIFKSSIGISLFEYITSSKVKYAKHVLLKSDKSVKEISFMLGFESESSFVSFFKRHTGIAPGTFRKQA